MSYRPEIDGLRAIAVLSVILVHAGLPWLPGGFIGVDIFFVISGFLITGILAAELATGRFSLARFYERRARRILPALVLVVALCLPFAWAWMLPWQLKEFSDSVLSVALFLSNVEFWRQSGYFATEAAAKPLLHTWSLGVEEQFYIVFPLLLWGLFRLRLRPAPLLAALALASLALAEWGWRHAPDANFYLIPFRAWELLAGALAALVAGRAGLRPDDRLGLAGLALIAGSLVLIDESMPFPSLLAVPSVAGTAMVLLWGGAGSVTARLLSWRPSVALGLVSYSAYLWHQPLFAFARIRLAEEPPPAVMAALTFATLALAWASWRWVETPFRRRPVPLLAGRARLFRTAGLALLLLALAGIGLRRVDEAGIRHFAAPGLSEDERKDIALGRDKGIRAGKCHYNRDTGDGITGFLDRWSCTNADEPGLVSLPAGIFGDSHAADKAHAIRLNGFDVLQMTGAGCPLIPGLPARPQCDALRDAFHAHMADLDLHTVILARRYLPEELTPDYLQSVVDYWTARYDSVYLFTPTPVFPDFDRQVQMLKPEGLRLLRPDPALREGFASAIAGVDLKGVHLIDTWALFCPDPAACAPWDSASKLVDKYHLSVHGAQELGRRLMASPDFPLAPR